MIKKLLTIALVCSSIIAGAQSFVQTYSFTATTQTTGVVDPTPVPTVTGLTFGSFVAVNTGTASAAAGRFAFPNQPLGGVDAVNTYSSMTGSLNASKYYEVILTPQAGYSVAIGGITFTTQRSGTGIRSYAVRASVDGFMNNLPAAVVSNTLLSVVGTNEFFWNLDATTSAQNGSTIILTGSPAFTSSVAVRFYGWNAEAATGNFGIDNVTFSGTVTAAATPTCAVTASVTSISSNTPICANQPLNLQATAIGDAPLTYSWTGAGSFNSTTVASPTVTGAASGNYILTVSNACGTATAVVSATVNPTPTVTVNNASICSGGSATLTATGAASYAWSPSATLSSATGSVVVANPTSTQIYNIIGTTGACSVAVSSTVSVISSPTLSVNSASICAGNTAILTASGVSTYTWTSPVSNNASVSVSPTSTTVYTVSGSAAGCAGTFSATGTVSVTPLPTVVISPASPTICAGQSTTLSVSGITTHTWMPGNLTTASITVNPSTQTTYTVTGLNSGCTGMNSAIVYVNALPTVAATSASVCTGKTTTLTASGTAMSYSWNPTSATTNTILVSAANAGVFTFTVTGTSAQGCSKSISTTLTGIATPTINVTATQSVICIGNPVTLTASGANTYVWTGGITNGTAFTPTATASYTVTGTVTAGSCTNTAVSSVTVNACTGINEAANATVLNVFPNPNNGTFVIQSTTFPATLVMYDVTGKQVLNKAITEMETVLNVSDLGNGMYYLSLSAEGNSANYKVVIAK